MSTKYETDTCDNCEAIRVANIPYVSKHFVGHIAAECPCGESGDFMVGKPRSEEMKAIGQGLRALFGENDERGGK